MLAVELLESIKKEIVKKKKSITESLIPQKRWNVKENDNIILKFN